MDEEGGRTGLWIGLFLSLAAAAVFIVLWFMRGGEVERLRTELRTAESAAVNSNMELEQNLRNARAESERSAATIADLEKRIGDAAQRARDEAGRLESRMRAEIDDAENRFAEANRRLEEVNANVETRVAERTAALTAELNRAGEELSRAKSDGQQELARLNAVLNQSKTTISDLESRLAERGAEAARAAEELTSLRERDQSSAAAAANLGDARTELERTARLLDDSRKAADALDGVNKKLEADLEREHAAAASRERELRNTISGLTGRIAELTAAPSPAASAPAAESTAGQARIDSLTEQLAAARREAETARKDYSAALSALQGTAEARMKQLEEEAAAKIEEVRQAFAKAEANAVRALRRENAELRKQNEDLRREAERTSQAPSTPERPIRSVGRIVELMSDCRTLLIDGGVNQRVRPGMKFDVYRAAGEGSRRIGAVEVIRVMEDFSMAVSTYGEAEVMVCPATGRAVLETGVKYSPFAAGDDGRPLELVAAGTVGVPLESPLIGDVIDNPFFDPNRQMTFVISPALRDDLCVAKAIEAIGGAPRSGNDGDFIIVPDGDVDSAAAGGPRRIELSHLTSYLGPAWCFQK